MTPDPDSAAAARRLGLEYAAAISQLQASIIATEADAVLLAAVEIADRVAADRLVFAYGPGGHSNLAAQEIFYRAGSLMHISAILDEGTLLSSGARRSSETERQQGYGRKVIERSALGTGDVLILVNAFGINSAVIDAALAARTIGATVIGLSSRDLAERMPLDHASRHPDALNLHDIVDIHIDSKVPMGDAVLDVAASEPTGSVSTFANAFALQWIVITAITLLVQRGIDPPVWRSKNAPGGDDANARFINRFSGRVAHL